MVISKKSIAGLSLLIGWLWFLKPLPASSQNIYYSKEQKFSFQNSDFSVVGRTGDRLYCYSASKEGYFLNAFDDSMQIQAKIALDFFPKQVFGTRFISYPTEILVFYQAIQSGYLVQYAARLDERAMLIGKPKALDSVKTGWFESKKDFFQVAASRDKSKVVLWGLGRNNLLFVLLDPNLEVLNRHKKSWDPGAGYEVRQALVDNEGRFYLSLLQTAGSKNYATHLRVYSFDRDGRKVQQEVPLKDQYLSGIYSTVGASDGQLHTAAFYATRKSGNIEGMFYCVYDAAGNQVTRKDNIAFSEALIHDADVKNKKKAFNDYVIRKVIMKEDGGFLLLAENAYVTTRTSMAPGFGYYSWYYHPVYADRGIREYHYGDILVADLSATGSENWHQFIRKSQYSQEDEGLFSSFALLNSGASLVFLFNNFTNSSSHLSIAVVDQDGSKQIQRFDTGKYGGDWLPKLAKQTSLTEWIIPVLNRNSLSFARVVF